MAATSEPQSGCPAQRSRGWLNSIALKLRLEERHRGTMPGTTERAPRYELYTSIQVDGGGEVLILTVKNLSLTGVLVAADGHDSDRLSSAAATASPSSPPRTSGTRWRFWGESSEWRRVKWR